MSIYEICENGAKMEYRIYLKNEMPERILYEKEMIKIVAKQNFHTYPING